MARPFELGGDWLLTMYNFTIDYGVGQARAVIAQHKAAHPGTSHLWTDGMILGDRFEWTDIFINDVLAEMRRRDNLNSEQAFHE